MGGWPSMSLNDMPTYLVLCHLSWHCALYLVIMFFSLMLCSSSQHCVLHLLIILFVLALYPLPPYHVLHPNVVTTASWSCSSPQCHILYIIIAFESPSLFNTIVGSIPLLATYCCWILFASIKLLLPPTYCYWDSVHWDR